MRAVRIAKPDHREERLFALGHLADPVHRQPGCDVGTFTLGFNHLAVVAEERIVLIKIRTGKPFIEAAVARAGRAVRAHGADVPFAEVSSRVAGLFQRLGDGDLLRPERVPPCKTTEAVGVAAGHHAAARWRTDGSRRIKPVEPQAGSRHLIHHRRLEQGMAVVACITPALVIGHAENEIRALIRQRPRQRSYCDEK